MRDLFVCCEYIVCMGGIIMPELIIVTSISDASPSPWYPHTRHQRWNVRALVLIFRSHPLFDCV
jgi:hypothetical protein